jgi:hypothetical protein
MFVTGAVMWWNRVVRKTSAYRNRETRRLGAPAANSAAAAGDEPATRVL